MSQTLTTFDMTTLLDSDEAISEYLSQVLADGDNEEFLRAIGYVLKARGMAQIAKDSGMGRENLSKAFLPGARPRFDTVLKVVHALGLDLYAQTGHAVNRSRHRGCWRQRWRLRAFPFARSRMGRWVDRPESRSALLISPSGVCCNLVSRHRPGDTGDEPGTEPDHLGHR